MKFFLVLMLAILVAIGGAVAPAVAQEYDKVFEELQTNNYWGTDENWTPSGEPEATDSVLIPATESCLIHNAGNDAVAELVDVDGTGTLKIEEDRKLTFTENSTIAGGACLYLFGTLTINGDLTVAGAASGNGGLLRLHRHSDPNPQWSSRVDGTGEITVSSGNEPGIVQGSGDIDTEIHNSGKVQAGGGFVNVNTYLRLNEAVDGSGQWWSTWGINLGFRGGVSGSGEWRTPEKNSPGANGANTLLIDDVESCVSGDIYLPYGNILVWEDFCTTGDLHIGSDHTVCLPQIDVKPGKVARFGVGEDNCQCP